MAQGCKHYVEGERLLAEAHRLAEAGNTFGTFISTVELAKAEFAAATAAAALAGRHGDPTRDATPVIPPDRPHVATGPNGIYEEHRS